MLRGVIKDHATVYDRCVPKCVIEGKVSVCVWHMHRCVIKGKVSVCVWHMHRCVIEGKVSICVWRTHRCVFMFDRCVVEGQAYACGTFVLWQQLQFLTLLMAASIRFFFTMTRFVMFLRNLFFS